MLLTTLILASALRIAPPMTTPPVAEVQYGPYMIQKLDVYKTNAPEPQPATIVWLHGGGWTEGDKRPGTLVHQHQREMLLSAGYNIISPNYRLAPAWLFPAAPEDVAAVVRWVQHRRLGGSWGLSPRVIIIGESAGGNLGALVAVAGYEDVACFVGIGGYYDLIAIEDSAPVGQRALTYLGCNISDCPETAQQASPYWRSMITPPMLLIHGELDDFVSAQQSWYMANRNGWFQSEMLIVAGAGHTGGEFNVPLVDNTLLDFIGARCLP